MTVTIRDVARKAGVSPITVSRAFSGTHPVAEETRRKVLKVAEELGYVPDLLARALVHKQSPIIGVVVLELVNPFFVHILDAVQAVTRQKDHMLLVNQSERQPDVERASVHQFRQMRVAGILITPATTGRQIPPSRCASTWRRYEPPAAWESSPHTARRWPRLPPRVSNGPTPSC